MLPLPLPGSPPLGPVSLERPKAAEAEPALLCAVRCFAAAHTGHSLLIVAGFSNREAIFGSRMAPRTTVRRSSSRIK